MNLKFPLHCGVGRIMATFTAAICNYTAVFAFTSLCFAGWVSAALGSNFAVFKRCCTYIIYLYVVVLLQDESHSNSLSFAFTGQEFRLYSVYAVFLSPVSSKNTIKEIKTQHTLNRGETLAQ